MQAIVLQGYGGPEQFACVEVPQPVPQGGEVLARLRASGVFQFLRRRICMTNATPTDGWTAGPGPDLAFAQLLARDEFRIQRCRDCGTHLFYPRLACTHCGGVDLAWVTPSGRGVVHAVSVVNRSAEKGGPYNVVLVDLAEGPRMMSRVEGVAHEAVRIGMAVQARVAPGPDGPCVVFDNVITGAAA